MNERKCLHCGRIQSQHPGMTFASEDKWCRCSICIQTRDTARTERTLTAFQRGFERRQITVNRRNSDKTPRNAG